MRRAAGATAPDAGSRTPILSSPVCGTTGQPPRATMPSYVLTACSVIWAVDGDSIGAVALGIAIVREP